MFFFSFFRTQTSNVISELNDDFSEDFFEVYHFTVSQKLMILENNYYFQLFLTTNNRENQFFVFFITKVSQVLPKPNDDFSGDFFEVYYVFLAQKLKILGFYR